MVLILTATLYLWEEVIAHKQPLIISTRNGTVMTPDAIFPHTKELEIPCLDLEKQADFIDLPVRGWGSVARRTRFRGTWHFYVDDTKFNALWTRPDDVLKTKAINVAEVNFSTNDQMPYPVALYRTYMKRWLARYWQENGLGIFVDLNVSLQYRELNMEGVPYGWKSYATAANDHTLHILEEHAEVASERAMREDFKLLVYGGGKKTAAMCEKNGWVHLRDARNEARK